MHDEKCGGPGGPRGRRKGVRKECKGGVRVLGERRVEAQGMEGGRNRGVGTGKQTGDHDSLGVLVFIIQKYLDLFLVALRPFQGPVKKSKDRNLLPFIQLL